MRNRIVSLLCYMLILGGAALTAPQAASASTVAVSRPVAAAAAAPCGLSYTWWVVARWRNCGSRGQQVGMNVVDHRGYLRTQYQCVPGYTTRYLAPTLRVQNAWPAGPC